MAETQAGYLLGADIGGTHSRIALADVASREIRFVRTVATGSATDGVALLRAALREAAAELGEAIEVCSAVLGVAGPVEGRRVRLTNADWSVDLDEAECLLTSARVRAVNDFEAAAAGVGALPEGATQVLQAGEPDASAPRVVLGAGTGFGVAYVVPTAAGPRVLPGEGGHVGFAPASELQSALATHLRAEVGRVTVEHVLSGTGLARIYGFLAARARGRDRIPPPPGTHESDPRSPATITAAALEGSDPLALAALDEWLAVYGAVAGDHALTVAARGGVFVAGGIAAKVLPRLAAGGFLSAFLDKAPHVRSMRRIPLGVVIAPDLGVRGAIALAAAEAGSRA
jgi:glucokinase